ncbi:MAG: hypothetical protein JWM04_1382, partial [Verrucomicrobiales bacterium]|nr:hypothetical protein [Verrucomicrobiales bacterium]
MDLHEPLRHLFLHGSLQSPFKTFETYQIRFWSRNDGCLAMKTWQKVLLLSACSALLVFLMIRFSAAVFYGMAVFKQRTGDNQ